MAADANPENVDSIGLFFRKDLLSLRLIDLLIEVTSGETKRVSCLSLPFLLVKAFLLQAILIRLVFWYSYDRELPSAVAWQSNKLFYGLDSFCRFGCN